MVNEFLSRTARRVPDKVALVCSGQRLTYAELYSQCERFADGLRARGVRRGDRVVIQLENTVEAVVSIFGTLEAGATFVFINATAKAEKVSFIVKDCGATALVSDSRAGGCEALALLPELPLAVLVGRHDADSISYPAIVAFDDLLRVESAGQSDDRQPISIDVAAIVYTSGSTGVPKGVTLSHDNIDAAATSITEYLENSQADVILNLLPLSFDYGLYQVLMAFKTGATLVLERSFAYPPVLFEIIAREHVTGFPIVPTIAALLARHDLAAHDLSSLRYITSTGAFFPLSYIAQLRRALPHVRIYSMYGITESKRVSYLPPEEIDLRPDSVGKPMPNVEVFVCDDEGNLQTHGTGELVVRGSNVMLGYWSRPEETAQALRPGFLPGERVLFTGDLFRIDEDGYLYFIARKDDIIKSRGEKVSPKEVEGVIHELAGIVEVSVVGVPDPVLGEAVKALVIVDPLSELSPEAITRHCALKLESFMVPQVVEFVTELPRTSSGKIIRSLLTRADEILPAGTLS